MHTIDPCPTTHQGRPLRIMQVHTFYGRYLDAFYAAQPRLAHADFAAQILALVRDGHAAVHIFTPYLASLGHTTQLIIANCQQSQFTWAKEHGIHSVSQHWMDEILRAQISEFKPDVLYIPDTIRFDATFLRSLSYTPQLVMGWRAADVPLGTDWTGYDVILSGLSPILHLAPNLGAKEGVYFLPGMPNWIARAVEDLPQTTDVVFSGGISPTQHVKRLAFLDILATAAHEHNFSLALYLACDPALITDAMRPYTHQPVFGLKMHETLRQGRIIVDFQGTIGLRRPNGSYAMDLAQGDTNNMRLFEGTGGGNLVLTEHQSGLRKIFEQGKEVATFSTPQEMIEKILYYLMYEQEREAIAAAGKARCLGEWNMTNRARHFLQIIRERIQ